MFGVHTGTMAVPQAERSEQPPPQPGVPGAAVQSHVCAGPVPAAAPGLPPAAHRLAAAASL